MREVTSGSFTVQATTKQKKTGDHKKLGAFKTEQAAKRYIDYCLKKREENDAKYSWRNFHIEKLIFYTNW